MGNMKRPWNMRPGIAKERWGVKPKIPIWPRRCAISGRWLWLELAYRINTWWPCPPDVIEEAYWLSAEEFLAARLKEEI
jgi:hypothetical protein